MSVPLLAAAAPASSVSQWVERCGADSGRIARAVVASALIAFVTYTLIAWGMQTLVA